MDLKFECSVLNHSEDKKSDYIKPINRETVHRICSGQVVLSLAIAVKELIENSIDAGAKSIEVKLKDYGMELVEVIDNGSGVRKENFEALTLKHYTSKIRQFNDLETIATLGFRGEALSSLCALCDLTIITRHSSADHGVKIQYDHNGKILSETPVARSPGTTVQLSKLFVPLPVRRKDFTKNHKKEFNKMCTLLYAYCLVAKGVKFTCSNQTSQGSNSKIVSTQGVNSIKDNIISIFGPKQIATLIELELSRPDVAILNEYNLKYSPEELEKPFDFEFEAFISSVTHGSGRSTTDRQFYFINSRPCEPTKIMKLVNEVYRQYNPNQYPFVFFNIKVTSSLVDVNVTPDKRQIFLEKEKLLLATVKSSLIEAFKYFPSTYKIQNTVLSSENGKKRVFEKSLENESNFDIFRKKIKKFEGEEKKERQFSLEDFKFKVEPKENNIELLSPPKCKSETETNGSFLMKFAKHNSLDLSGFKSNKNDVVSICNETTLTTNNCDDNQSLCEVNESVASEDNFEVDPNLQKNGSGIEKNDSSLKTNEELALQTTEPVTKNKKANINYDREILDCNNEIIESTQHYDISKEEECLKNDNDFKTRAELDSSLEEETISCKIMPTPSKKKKIKDDTDEISSGKYRRFRKRTIIDVTLNDIQLLMQSIDLKNVQKSELSVKFRTEISPSANEKAEAELKKQISKDMFDKMKIIGQFNYAFIVTSLERDLFIIDQHATDEKYNFEELQRNTILDSQPLVNPKDLQLTAANEIILIENLEVFKKNGFHFQIDENVEATKKVKLTKIPVSKSYIFGKDDIEEMLYMLQEGFDDSCCRPSRVRGMFASRACRKSVMVGKPLTKSDMRRLVDHMGQIDQPWNCPHGRPTMRHLINLDLLHKN